MAEQDEIVEIMARALLAEEGFAPEHITPALRSIARHRAPNLLSALTAAGCEVVRWRDYLTDDASPSEQAHFSNLPAGVVADGKIAILRGPQGGTP